MRLGLRGRISFPGLAVYPRIFRIWRRRTGGKDDRAAGPLRRQQKEAVVSSSSEFDPTQAGRSSMPAVERGSEMQAIVILGSPEPGETDQMELTGMARTEPKEADPILSALQVIHPSDESRPGRSKFMWFGLPRPPLPERIIDDEI